MADREMEVVFLMPDGEQEPAQLCVSASGADLVDEVLSLCGLGLTDRNRRRVVLANQETGELVHGCGALGEVEWGDVATVEVALALSSRPVASADVPDSAETERALAAAAEYEQAIAATLARAEEARRSGAGPEACARCLGALIGKEEGILRNHAFASMRAMKAALKRATGTPGALSMDAIRAVRDVASAEELWQSQLNAMEQALNPDCTAGDDASGAAGPGTTVAGAGSASAGRRPGKRLRDGDECPSFRLKASAELAEKWSRQVGVGFAHARDPAPGGSAGSVYSESFRFRRSVAGVWSSASLGFYAEQKAAGRELESSHGQDVNQLAGDMVVGSDGRILMAYYSRDNTDRPSVDAILAAVAKDSAAQSDAAAASVGEGTDWVLSLPDAPVDDADHPAASVATVDPLPPAAISTEASACDSSTAAQAAGSLADTAASESADLPLGLTAADGPVLAAWAAVGSFVGTLLALAASRVVFGTRPAE